MTFPFEIVIDNENQTAELAKKFAMKLSKGDLILLTGELGSGKTTFIKFICQTWKINNVLSPSFAIVNEYNGDYQVYHFDFFRVNKISELYDIGISDYFTESEAVIFIEWAELYKEILPTHSFNVNIKFESEGKRKFTLNKL